ncbi:MAG: glycosyltransferase family A protein [Pseudomonadota bacterium]
MDISVIIPTHNRADLLERALDSVLKQTLQPGEIIVVDDGSTDHTAALVKDGFPQVVLLQQDNLGVSRARNQGIASAHGEWLAFLDSDDEWLPNKLERQHQALMADSSHLICHWSHLICHCDEVWIRKGRRVNPMNKHAKHGGEIFHYCLPRCVISPSAVLIHGSVFNRVGGFDESLPACEDYDLWLRICARYPVLFIPQTLLLKYGGHSDQLSRRYWGMDRFRIQALEKLLSSDELAPSYRSAALSMLLEKLEIVLNGAKKRDNVVLIRDCSEKLKDYRQMLKRLEPQEPSIAHDVTPRSCK